ncbi:MAG: Ig domain-containing protein, partial [Oscillospiraceae bacterium]|nr:Ig domain-containing protein [Oscillospiraceae bacterium]
GDVWDGSIEAPAKLVKKDGVNYYEITKCSQLAYVAQEGGEWLARNYLLAKDLILNKTVLEWDEAGNLTTDTGKLKQWTPIGYFTGKFDGGGHTVSGLYVNKSGDCAGLFGSSSGTIKDVTVVNAYVKGDRYVGGVCGSGGCTGCVYSGAVTGSGNVGGVCGSGGATGCANYGAVTGTGEGVGGVCGYAYSSSVSNCCNTAAVTGKTNVGGVCGYSYSSSVSNCCNTAAVTGSTNVGGVCGYSDKTVSDCCNTAKVTGESNVGGVAGSLNNGTVTNCYSRGNVKCTVSGNNAGAIVGSDGAVWDKDTITGCHYLRTDKINTGLYGCGGVSEADMEPGGFFANTAAELKKQATYEGWNFSGTWAISSTRNGGYPYLTMEDELPGHSGEAEEPVLTGLTLSETSLSLRAGDVAYLTVTPSPESASLPALTWKSGKTSVATVNKNGRVTAVGAGTAKITVTGGGFSAVCTVTVTAREANEYRINSITLRSASGAELTKIPKGSFLATVSVTKLTDGGDTLLLLAAYTADGQFTGLVYAGLNGIPAGATIELLFPVDNTGGEIASLKAFSIASLSNPTPLGEAVSFPAQ